MRSASHIPSDILRVIFDFAIPFSFDARRKQCINHLIQCREQHNLLNL